MNSSFLTLLGRLTFFLIFSFILIHLLSFLGVFLAIAYPILWLVYPRSVPCLFCRSSKEGKRCPFCHQTIKKTEVSPKFFASAVYNGLTILLISLVCLGIVFAEYKLVFEPLAFVPRTVVFTIPSKASYRLEEIFPMKIEITDLKVPVNAVQADIGFDAQRLEVVDISTKDSFATIFIQKEINNKIGYARLSGGLPNPGFSGSSGTFGTIYFRGKSAGMAKVEFLPSSLVLANNGRGSSVLREFGAVYYLILPEKISAKEKEQQEAAMKTGVLGEATEGETGETQLKFYEEERVLGSNNFAPTSVPARLKKEINLSRTFLGTLQQVDRFILRFWGINKVR